MKTALIVLAVIVAVIVVMERTGAYLNRHPSVDSDRLAHKIGRFLAGLVVLGLVLWLAWRFLA